MKKIKISLSMLLPLFILFGSLPGSTIKATATEVGSLVSLKSTEPAENFEYYAYDYSIEITKYKGTSSKVIIPDTIDGKPVRD